MIFLNRLFDCRTLLIKTTFGDEFAMGQFAILLKRTSPKNAKMSVQSLVSAKKKTFIGLPAPLGYVPGLGRG